MKVKKASDICPDCGRPLLGCVCSDMDVGKCRKCPDRIRGCSCPDLAPKGADAAYEKEREKRSGMR